MKVKRTISPLPAHFYKTAERLSYKRYTAPTSVTPRRSWFSIVADALDLIR